MCDAPTAGQTILSGHGEARLGAELPQAAQGRALLTTAHIRVVVLGLPELQGSPSLMSTHQQELVPTLLWRGHSEGLGWSYWSGSAFHQLCDLSKFLHLSGFTFL